MKLNTFTGMGDYTPPIDDNLLEISDRDQLNEEEAKGIIRAEEFLYEQDESVEISAGFVLELHKTAFGHLYEWAGQWRKSDFKVGSHIPPRFNDVPTLMYQFLDELSFRLGKIKDIDDLVSVIAYAHHRMVYIHPFNNGNGRSARLLADLIALINGYDHIILYHREGEARKTYLKAIGAADQHDYSLLENIIKPQLRALK